MNVEKYISDLLFRYECVIIPDFGGLVTQHRSAEIHPVTHIFKAPYKQLSFNVKLNKNDGLLANYIASANNISYNKALGIIRAFVVSCKRKLKKQKRLVIARVGRFHLDKEGNIQFSPSEEVNYLTDSYGMNAYRSPAVKRKKELKKGTVKPVVPRPKKKEKEEKKRPWLRVAVILILLIATLTILGITQRKWISKTYHSYSYLLPFTTSKENTAPEEVAEEPVTAEEPTETTATADDEPESVETSAKVVPHYHIIGGSFKRARNARELVDELQEMGYDASIIDTNENQFFRVSYKSCFTKEEALQELRSIRNRHNGSAWLLLK